MPNEKRVSHPMYRLLATEIQGFDALAELALDMRWSWNHATDRVWHQLDPDLWELTHNPWAILQTVSSDKIEKTLSDPDFHQLVEDLIQSNREDSRSSAWFQQAHPKSPLTQVAYFSMEFMLHEALPIYSGGLGNVAGDQLKAASDLGLPVVGIGLLYQQGYFHQVIDKQGRQQELYPYNDPGQLPITPLRSPNGEWLRLKIEMPECSVWVRAWQVKVGRVRLLLLDSNDPANSPVHRGITSELYGGGLELRLMQEMLLGIGGRRLLAALDIHPEVCHLNEGHAALAVLERARAYMEDTGLSFETALTATRAGNLFTTHTAVPAAFDVFSPELMERYLGGYARDELGISFDDFLALGRRDPGDSSESFNMAYLALHGSGCINAVSRLHGRVSRNLFGPLFPHWPQAEVPIGHVTNGVHMPTWDSPPADQLWTEACGKDRWLGTTESLEDDIRKVSDARLWQFRTTASQSLIEFARVRLSQQLTAVGAPPDEVKQAGQLFDPNALTLGFARRFATYKRPNLLLHDPERLLRILTNPERPVQLFIAGKAHPADEAGQALITEWVHFIRRPEARPHVIFLSDYDMFLTARLVRGVDVWINTPRRPWEACGTSGMKVLVNGGINLSELDGWWAEAYSPEVGWAIGDGEEHGDNPQWDAAEANSLYEILENEIVPEFYTHNEEGIPTAWVNRMRESMARLTPQFHAGRTVKEYAEEHYLPAATNYRKRTAKKGALGQDIVNWRHDLADKWGRLRFGELSVASDANKHTFHVEVYLDNLDPKAVRVELFADGAGGAAPIRQPMKNEHPLPGAPGGFVFSGSVPASRPAGDYTPRIVPHRPDALVPLEVGYILWQR